MIRSAFDQKSGEFIDEARIQAICYSVNKRIHYLKEYAESHLHNVHQDSIKDDVAANVAQTYST